MPPTAAISASVAAAMRRTEPNRFSRSVLRVSPTPSTSSRTDSRIRLSEAAVVGDREAMRFVAQPHQHVERRTAAFQQDRFRSGAVDDDLLELLGQADGRDVPEAEFVERAARGAELRDAAVDHHQIGQGRAFGLAARIAAADDFGDAQGVVDPLHAADPEAAVALRHGRPVDRGDHRGDGEGAADVGDVEALDDVRRSG